MLTDSRCRTAKCRDKAYKLTDAKGLYLEVKPTGVKAWRYRFKLTKAAETKESGFAIGDYAHAPPGETPDQAKARRDGRRFTLAEARDQRTRAFAHSLRRVARHPPRHRHPAYQPAAAFAAHRRRCVRRPRVSSTISQRRWPTTSDCATGN